MGTFLITGPDGKKYRVTGDTAEGALAALKKMQGGAVPPASEGYSSTTPGRTEADFWSDVQNDVIAERPISSRIATALQGVPFIGEYADNVIGAFSPEAGQATRVAQEAMADQRPGQTIGLQVAGGVAAAAPLAAGASLIPGAGRAAASLVGSSRVTTAAKTALAGAAGGAVEGAVSGYGEGSGGDLAAAGERALIGGGIGGAVGVAAPLAAEGLRNMLQAFKTSDIKTIADAFGVSTDAAKVIKKTLQGDDLVEGAQRIQAAGPNSMLADAGPGTRGMLDAVASVPGAARRIATEAVDARATAAGQQLVGALDGSMGAPQGRYAAMEAIRKASAAPRKAAYDAAYANPIDYSSPQGRAIEQTLARINPRILRPALEKANTRMQWDGMPSQIMASIGDDGRVAFSEMPNAIQLDYIKRGLDDVVREGTDVSGKMTPEARLAEQMAREVKLRHAAANPDYRKALSTAADSIQMENAIDAGYKALGEGSTREELTMALRGANRNVRDAAVKGARQYIDDTMARAREVISDPGRTKEAAEALKALNTLASGAAKEKLRILMGPQEADKLIREFDEIRTAFTLRAALATNSKTAPRQAFVESADEVTAPGALGALTAGEFGDASKRFVQLFTGATSEMQQLRREGIYEEVARALTSIRGPQAEGALRVVERAMRGQKVTEAQARFVARALTGAGASGVYQAGTQAIENR